MLYVAYAAAAVWACGIFILVARVLGSLRLTLNNLRPGANYWSREYEPFRKGYSTSRIDPALFNDEGRKHFKRLSFYGNLMSGWLIIGFILAVWLSTYLAE